MDCIRELVQLLRESTAVSQIEYRVGFGWLTVRLVKAQPRTKSRQGEATSVLPVTTVPAASRDPIVRIFSETVGRFSRKPKSGGQLVAIGAPVTPETILGYIDMGLRIEIPAGVSGVLRECSVVEGQGVEYGQQLFIILASPPPGPSKDRVVL
ncbi:MAG: hypothetical protein HY340_01445 [Candidatus Kerfeldbacteria bacterium]|nr:hypothetical protein [Candidatus Kerfeldbacteria bacterium]